MEKVGRGGRSKSAASQNHQSEKEVSDHVSEVISKMRGPGGGGGGGGKRESHMSSHVSQMEAIEEHANGGGNGIVAMTMPVSRSSMDVSRSGGAGREVSTSIYGNEEATINLMEKVKQLNSYPKP